MDVYDFSIAARRGKKTDVYSWHRVNNIVACVHDGKVVSGLDGMDEIRILYPYKKEKDGTWKLAIGKYNLRQLRYGLEQGFIKMMPDYV